jgi:hypothetical protein
MGTLIITINGKQFELGMELPNIISSIEIINDAFPKHIRIQDVPYLKQWLNELVTRCSADYILYNNILIETKSINKF